MKVLAGKLSACLLVACSISLLHADNLLTAIDQVDVQRVKQFLENGQLAHGSKEYQARVLKTAYNATEIAQKATQRFLPSYNDLIRIAIGRGFVYCSSTAMVLATLALLMEDRAVAVSALGVAGLTGTIGLNQIYKGWTRFSARKQLAKAREIETLVAQHVGQ